VDLEGWAELAPALAWRLWRRAWIDLGRGRDLERVHLERLQRFALEGLAGRGGRVLELPGGLRARCRPGALVLDLGPPGPDGEREGRC
jgi:hypothetical protein